MKKVKDTIFLEQVYENQALVYKQDSNCEDWNGIF